MSDIGLFLVNNCWDLKVENGDFVGDEGLETAVSISLFTERRVSDEQLPDQETNKKGWWGDMFPDVDQDQIGSRLWTLERAKRTTETLRLYEDYSREALQWLIEDGVADSVEVSAEYDSNGQLIGTIVIAKPANEETRFLVNWDAQELKGA